MNFVCEVTLDLKPGTQSTDTPINHVTLAHGADAASRTYGWRCTALTCEPQRLRACAPVCPRLCACACVSLRPRAGAPARLRVCMTARLQAYPPLRDSASASLPWRLRVSRSASVRSRGACLSSHLRVSASVCSRARMSARLHFCLHTPASCVPTRPRAVLPRPRGSAPVRP
jgi:hypothetical protein